MTEKKEQKGLTTGAGIAIAGFLLAIAILVSGSGLGADPDTVTRIPGSSNLEQVDETDHIYGNPDAEITLIEYSDFGCHFCGVIHPRLVSLVEKNENVRWVYRHYPVRDMQTALASECVADLGGNESFWDFASFAFENQGNLNQETYLAFTSLNNIDSTEFLTCLEEERFKEKIDNDYLDGQLSGLRGTPLTVVVTPDGKTLPVSGAQSEESFQTLIDQLSERY
jgi:protein-disulfide isomerase